MAERSAWNGTGSRRGDRTNRSLQRRRACISHPTPILERKAGRKPSSLDARAAVRPVSAIDRADLELDRERPVVDQAKQGGHPTAQFFTRRTCGAAAWAVGGDAS